MTDDHAADDDLLRWAEEARARADRGEITWTSPDDVKANISRLRAAIADVEKEA